MRTLAQSYKLWLTLLLAPPLLLAGAVFWMASQLSQETSEVAQSTDLLRTTEAVLSSLKDAETGQRGYLITDDLTFLGPYEIALQELPIHLMRLKELTTSSPQQQDAVARIHELVSLKLEQLDRTITLRQQDRLSEAREVVREGTGQELMQELRVEIDHIYDSAALSLQENRRSQNQLGSLFLILAGGSLVLTGAGLLALYRVGAAQEASKAEAKTEALLQTNQNLEDFARIAAHDLRAPTRTAISLLQLGKRKLGEDTNEESIRMFDRVENTLRRQLQLIEDLLTYQQVGSEAIPELEKVPLENLVQEASANLQNLIEQNAAQLKVGDLPEVNTHPRQAVQLFQNLIENAVKYRDPARIPIIEISAVRQRGSWVIRVRDNGVGFEQEYADEVFRPFARLHASTHPGSGVGLATCMKIVERSGGRLWVESEVGKGSSFYVSFPAD